MCQAFGQQLSVTDWNLWIAQSSPKKSKRNTEDLCGRSSQKTDKKIMFASTFPVEREAWKILSPNVKYARKKTKKKYVLEHKRKCMKTVQK